MLHKLFPFTGAGKTFVKKTVFVVLSIFVFSSLSPAAFAVSPEDALSARPANAVFSVVRIDNLHGILQSVFSMSNIETMASFSSPQDAQMVRLFGSFASQIPAQSIVVASGVAGDGEPFVQIAALMPESLRPRMARVADGSASGVDLVTLLLGDGALMLAAAFAPEVVEGSFGPYYVIDGQASFAARGDLLLMALSPDELEASVAALDNEANRLVMARRFDSPNFMYLHMDMQALAVVSGEDVDEIARHFSAPLILESTITTRQDSVLWSTTANILQSMTDAGLRYGNIEPVVGANLFLAGGGRLLVALSGATSFEASDLMTSPELMEGWDTITSQLELIAGISEAELVDLLNGSLTIAIGSDATIFDRSTPGGYVALTGRDGAAANIFEKIMSNEGLSYAIPMAPLNIEGWDSLFMVDPALVPVPLLIGVKGDTLFLGVVDADALTVTPELPTQAVSMLEQPLISASFVDVEGIWNWLRQEMADSDSLLLMPLLMVDFDGSIRTLINMVLEAEPSVPFVTLWSSELEVAFAEFSITEVAEGDRILPRVLSIIQMFAPM